MIATVSTLNVILRMRRTFGSVWNNFPKLANFFKVTTEKYSGEKREKLKLADCVH